MPTWINLHILQIKHFEQKTGLVFGPSVFVADIKSRSIKTGTPIVYRVILPQQIIDKQVGFKFEYSSFNCMNENIAELVYLKKIRPSFYWALWNNLQARLNFLYLPGFKNRFGLCWTVMAGRKFSWFGEFNETISPVRFKRIWKSVGPQISDLVFF